MEDSRAQVDVPGAVHLVLDLVQSASGAALAIAVRLDRAWPERCESPDLQHANSRFLAEVIGAGVERLRPTGVVAVQFSIGDEAPTTKVLELLEFMAWRTAADGGHVQTILLSERAGWAGEARSIGRRLPDQDDIAASWAHFDRDARAVFAGRPGRAPVIQSVAFGGPLTTEPLLLARAAATHVLAFGAPSETLVVQPIDTASVSPALRALSVHVAVDLTTRRFPSVAVAEQLADASTRTDAGSALVRAAADRALDVLMARLARLQPSRRGALLTGLVNDLETATELRTGDYRAEAAVLDRLARGDVDLLEQSLRGDPWTLARAYQQALAIANHIGAVDEGAAALRRAREYGRRETSLRGHALLLQIETLAAVHLQNRWPFSADDAAAAQAMEDAAAHLGPVVDEARRLRERLLVLSNAPTGDAVLAEALGTLGRTLAFVGHHDGARERLLEARTHLTSERDLAVNACHLCQVELDTIAPSPERFGECLTWFLDDAGRHPEAVSRRLFGGDRGHRFTLNVLLKALVQGVAVVGAVPEQWQLALQRDDPDSILAALRASPSHPTELVARRAAELLSAGPARERWFDLAAACALSDNRPTLLAIAAFTCHLRAGGRPDTSALRGSLLNPCFEYR